MASAGKYSFSLQRGSTDTRKFVARTTAGVPVDITGYSVRMQIRTAEGATGTTTTTTLVLNLPDGAGIEITDAAVGEITLSLTAANTITLCPTNTRTRLSYGIEIYQGSPEEVVPILQGTITMLPEVVRA